MKILIVGGGGREHALSWKSACSSAVETVYIAPGNAGTATENKVVNVAIESSDIESLIRFARLENIDLTIIGPEAPLVAGICDQFAEAGLACFGPSKNAAQLEGSKSFAKNFMEKYDIPTARYQSFTDPVTAISYLDRSQFPTVIKADGLAAGKGVVIASDRKMAEATILKMLADNAYGDAGKRIVIEDYLAGQEVSFICIVDGKNILPMATSQDHKAAYDGDLGPNTGGMGAYSPSQLVDDSMFEKIMNLVVIPTVRGMANEGMPYTGFLYAGLMIGSDNVPNVVEFNCRFGDPEAQPVLTRLQSDLVEHCMAAVQGNLEKQSAKWDPRPCVGVVMAANGYPGNYDKGNRITGLDSDLDNARVFHAGTTIEQGNIVTNGGRVLCVTAMGDTLMAARNVVYQRIDQISWPGAWFRSDIGYRAISQ